MSNVVSEHKDRVVYDEGEQFRKVFTNRKARDEELDNLRALEAIGVPIPRILDTSGNLIVTAPLKGIPLDEFLRTRWATMPRRERSALIPRIAAVCRKIRDGGFDWPDLVTYHLWISDEEIAVLDPARLHRGRLDLSPLYWSTAAPTVSRSDRLRFWRAYAGKQKPQRLRNIGHRGRFRPYRWVCQNTGVSAPCPPFARFVNVTGEPFASADEIASHARLEIKRTLKDRTNAVLDDLVVKIVVDAKEVEVEWENHRMLMGSGIRVPQPAVGGVLEDGRGLFATKRLIGLYPMDDVWDTLDRRVAVRAAVDVARSLHAGGLVHKDLYLCHLFIAKGGRDITLIDLARMTRTTSWRLRVKDLAALVHSARGLASRTDLLRGLKRYGGNRKLARAVMRKARRMGRHVPQNIRDGTHVPHVKST